MVCPWCLRRLTRRASSTWRCLLLSVFSTLTGQRCEPPHSERRRDHICRDAACRVSAPVTLVDVTSRTDRAGNPRTRFHAILPLHGHLPVRSGRGLLLATRGAIR